MRHVFPSRSLIAALFCAAPVFAGIVTGTVRNGAGVALASVVVSAEGGTNSFTTGATGTFSLTLAAGVYTIDFAPPNTGTPLYAPSQVFLVTVPASGVVSLGNVTLQSGFVLTGTVTTTLGVPLNGCDTDVFVAATGLKLLTPSDNTNASGVYSVVVPAGVYHVNADAPVGQLYVSTAVNNVTVTGPAATTAPLIQLPNGFSLSGTVVNAAAQPVVNVNIDVENPFTGVRVTTPNDLTDAAGFFSVVVPPGVFRLSFKPAPGVLLVAKQVEDVPIFANLNVGTVPLSAGQALSGTVLGPGGAPVAAADVDVDATLGPLRIYTPYDATNAAGQWSVVVPPGTYKVNCDGGVGTNLVAGEVGPIVVGGASLVAPTISLAAGFALSGVVTGWNGQPEAGCFVKVVDASTSAEMLLAVNQTSATGSFAANLPAGTYHVTFTPQHLSLSRQKTVNAVVVGAGGATLNTNLQMAPVAAYVGPTPGQPATVFAGGPIYLDVALYHPNPGLAAPPILVSLEFVDPAGAVTPLVPAFFVPIAPGQVVAALALPFFAPTLPASYSGFPSRFRFRALNANTLEEVDRDDFKITLL